MSDDELVLEELRKAGADLTQPREVVHYLYFGDEEQTHRAGRELAAEGFEVEAFAPDEHVAEWSLHARHDVVVDAAGIARLRTRLEQLARETDGDYDGWEAAVD